MKIVLATPLYPPQVGGPATYAKALHDAFVGEGHQVRVVRYGLLERTLPVGLRHGVYFLRLLPATVGADAALAFDTWSVGLPALAATQLLKKKLVVRIGGDFLWESYVGRTKEPVRLSDFYTTSRAFSSKEKMVYAGTRKLVGSNCTLAFNTSWQRDIWQKAYGFDASRAMVVENFFPSERRAMPAKGKVFVSAGREHPLKNQKLLETVFAKVKEDYPDISLDTRSLPPDEHRARLRDAYAVIVASLSEVNPNTLIDAIGAGKPFIGPTDSGANDALRAAGQLIDTSDPHALETAIRTLLDPLQYDTWTKRSRECTFSRAWADVASDFLTLLS